MVERRRRRMAVTTGGAGSWRGTSPISGGWFRPFESATRKDETPTLNWLREHPGICTHT